MNEIANRTEKVQLVRAELGKRLGAIRALLPAQAREDAMRIVGRAVQYFARSDTLAKCSVESFVRCVVEAAELGFTIDGRMAHAVPFKADATLIVDYKGLIAVAKRSGLIRDCWASLVFPADTWEHEERDGLVHYSHKPDLTRSRSNIEDALFAYAVATHRDGWYRLEAMPMGDILAIRGRSKSYTSGGNSPWKTDPGEMAKKTVIRRLLKTFADDPGLARAMEADVEDVEPEPVKPAKVTLDDLARRPAPETETPTEQGPSENELTLGDYRESINNAPERADVESFVAMAEREHPHLIEAVRAMARERLKQIP